MTRLVRFSNNAVSRLAANITNVATTISLTPGDGAKFPIISGTQFFMATLIKADGTTEIVKVTARSSDTLTVVRAAEPVGSTQVAYAFTAGDRIEQRLTAKALSDELDRLDSGANIGTANKTANYTVLAADVSTLIRVDTTAGAITVTLPQISSLTDDFDIMVAKVTGDANLLNVVRAGSTDLINGAASYVINNQWQSVWLISDRSTGTWTAINSGAGSTNVTVDSFTGSGTAGPFTLSGDPGSKNNTAVYVGGVYQQKATYTLSGTSLTLGGTVEAGVAVEVMWAKPNPIGVPSDGTVTTAKLADDAVTTAKIVDLNVTTGKLADDAVTFAKMQNVATGVVLGRSTAGTGDVEALTGAQATALLSAASETVSGRVELADATEAAAGSDGTKALSPLRLRDALNASGSAPIYACRAWVNFNGTGTVAIRASGNVSSITDNGTGDYTVNFATAMPDANYAFATSTLTQIYSGGEASFEFGQHPTVAPTSSAFRVAGQRGDTSAALDITNCSVSIFR